MLIFNNGMAPKSFGGVVLSRPFWTFGTLYANSGCVAVDLINGSVYLLQRYHCVVVGPFLKLECRPFLGLQMFPIVEPCSLRMIVGVKLPMLGY